MNYIEEMNSEERLVKQSFDGKYVLPINVERLEKNYPEYLENIETMKEQLDMMGADVNMGGDALDIYMDNISQSIHLYKLFRAIRKNFEDIGIYIDSQDIVLAKLFNALFGAKPFMSYMCSSIIEGVQEAYRFDTDYVELSQYSDVIDELCTHLDNRVTAVLREKLDADVMNNIDTLNFISKALYHGVAVHVNAKGEFLYLKTEVVRDNQSDMNAAMEWEESCKNFEPVASFTRGVLFTMLVERIIELVQNGTLVVTNDKICAYAGVPTSAVDTGETNLLHYLNQLYVDPQDKLMGMNKIISTLAGHIFLLGNSKED